MYNRYNNFARRRRERHPEPCPPGFNPNDPQYLCFCRTLHSLRGAYAVGYFHIVSAVATFVFGCLMTGNPAVMALTIPLSIIVAFFSGLLLFGLRARFYKLLVPYLVMNIFLVLGVGIGFVMAMIDLIHVANTISSHSEIGQAVLIVAVCLLGLLAEVWFFLTVLASLRYIRDKEIADNVARLVARNIYAGQEFSPEAEMERISAEYRLPPPPPAYSRENLAVTTPQQLGVSFPPNFDDGPPGYEEACSSASTSRTSLGPEIVAPNLELSSQNSATESEKPELHQIEDEKNEDDRANDPVLTV